MATNAGDNRIARRMNSLGFRKVGEPYDPNQGFIEKALPQSIFTSAFMAPLIIHKSQYMSHFLPLLLPQIICYTAAVIIQGAIVYYLWSIVDEKEEEEMCIAGDVWIRIFCVCVFVGRVFADLVETMEIHEFVAGIPTWKESRDKPVLAKACDVSGLTSFPHQKYESSEYEGETAIKPATGITVAYRVWIYMGFILVKAAIATALLYVGSGHILASGDKEELILNTLAAVFVFDIDDIIYNFMIPRLYKYWIETSAKYTTCEDEEDGLCKLFGFYVVTPVFCAACVGMKYAWC